MSANPRRRGGRLRLWCWLGVRHGYRFADFNYWQTIYGRRCDRCGHVWITKWEHTHADEPCKCLCHAGDPE